MENSYLYSPQRYTATANDYVIPNCDSYLTRSEWDRAPFPISSWKVGNCINSKIHKKIKGVVKSRIQPID